MNPNSYFELSSSTSSIKDVIQTQSHTKPSEFLADVIDVIIGGDNADILKRALFYGESHERLSERAHNHLMNQEDLDNRLFALEKDNTPLRIPAATISYIHAALGLASEASEMLAEAVTSIIEGRDLDATNCKEELGDVLWYFAEGARSQGLTFDDISDANIRKLNKRYGEKFSAKAALDRDLEAELKALV